MSRASPDSVPGHEPFALVAAGGHGLRISSLNRAARARGIEPGLPLADARTRLPSLVSRPADTEADHKALLTLALWCGRYGPARNLDITAHDDLVSHGLWIDATGVAHLFGGEEALLADLEHRMAGFGVSLRAAIAGTYGAAHALARFPHPARRADSRPAIVIPAGREKEALAPLPVACLRLAPQTVLTLRRLGLSRVGDLYGVPRAALARRFRAAGIGAEVTTRLDQALGVAQEPLRPLADLPSFAVRRSFSEPLVSHEAIEGVARALVDELCRLLAAHEQGARRVRLTLYRADGTAGQVRVALGTPSREEEHIWRLIAEKLAGVEAGFGIDLVTLEALEPERLAARQAALQGPSNGGARVSPALLLDRLANRIGAERIVRLTPAGSHIPEKAQEAISQTGGTRGGGVRRQDGETARWRPHTGLGRPCLLLEKPETIRVVAEVPEGPPRRFLWRRVEHRVTRAQGPERIAPEWWLWLDREDGKDAQVPDGGEAPRPAHRLDAPRNRPRDYYRLEDAHGTGFFVFREGLYRGGADEESPSWFIHGLYG